MKSLACLGLICIIVVGVSACTGQPTPSLSPLSPSVQPSKSPIFPTPTPPKLTNPAKGGVKGRLVLRSTGAPLLGFSVYLGDTLPIQPGDQHAITFQEKSSPHVDVDAQGNFAFVDVTPNTYALVLWTPLKSLVVPDPKQPTKELSIVVKAGEITDLGDIVSDMP